MSRVRNKLPSKRQDFFIQTSENRQLTNAINISNQITIIRFHLLVHLVLCIYFVVLLHLGHQIIFVKSSASELKRILEIPTGFQIYQTIVQAVLSLCSEVVIPEPIC